MSDGPGYSNVTMILNGTTQLLDFGQTDEIPDMNDEYIFDRNSVRIIFFILYSVVFFLCFVGNLIVLLVVSLHWRMRNITKLCLTNLAAADLCVGIFCVYQNLSTYLIQSWVLGEFLCKMYQFINGLSHTAAVLTLVVVCIERYLAIVHPFTCRLISTKNRLRAVIATVWLASGLYCSPRLLYMVTIEVPIMDLKYLDEDSGISSGGVEIICTARRTLYDSKTFDMINSILLYLLPLLLMSILYFRMGLVLWQSGKLWSRATLQFQKPRRLSVSENNLRNGVTQIPLVSRNNHRRWSIPPGNNEHYSPDSSPQGTPDRQFCSEKYNRMNKHSELERNSRDQEPFVQQNQVKVMAKNKYNNNKMNSKFTEPLLGMRSRRREDLKSRQAVVRMLMVIVAVFALCNLPFHLRKLALYWVPEFDLGSVSNILLLPLSNLCMYVNCAVNPIIYSFMSSSFRNCLRDLISCRYRRGPSSQLTSMA